MVTTEKPGITTEEIRNQQLNIGLRLLNLSITMTQSFLRCSSNALEGGDTKLDKVVIHDLKETKVFGVSMLKKKRRRKEKQSWAYILIGFLNHKKLLEKCM